MIIEPDILLTDLFATSKKHVFRQVAAEISAYLGFENCSAQTLLAALIEREHIGSTGIGGGVAIPHVRVPCLDHCISVFVRLDSPVKFDAPDGQDVDLIYVFLAPENPDTKTASLMQLARISHFFRDEEFCTLLRTSDDVKSLICARNTELLQAA